jgi:predicted house-cleaning noncanonical NTP pyrophosphatase (MazG superfamily)
MSETEFQQALREKLSEEAGEAASAPAEELVTELADLYEVMDALIATSGLSEERVRQVQAQRRINRGGFTQRLRLLWTEDAPYRLEVEDEA